MRFALDSNPRLAKYSARLLALSANKEEFCRKMMDVSFLLWWYSSYSLNATQTISEDLNKVDHHRLVAHVAVLAELARTAPGAFESKSEVVMNFIVKQILMTPSPPDPVCVPPTYLSG